MKVQGTMTLKGRRCNLHPPGAEGEWGASLEKWPACELATVGQGGGGDGEEGVRGGCGTKA